ncbi:MAG: NADH-quinone oxidoreductase subunit N [Myxococcaceae bacterium]|nr:NADH-quinone oxidoreductase subunit N [Myxococcaceae bacterium]MCI0671133.1 NADH-quinone oxidoreductase subunit N [Myxococcaceae bacterium]
MRVPSIPAADFLPLVPAIILLVGACVLLMTEVFLRSPSRGYQAPLSLFFTGLAGAVSLSSAFEPARPVFQGFAAQDPFSSAVTLVVCVALGLAVLTSSGFLRSRNAERGEFYALMLFAASGMSLLAMSTELITLFINIEVLSVGTYALTSYLRRGTRPAEAGFKYFILGAFSSAILLYGAALLYGATGSTKLSEMAVVLPAALAAQPALVYAGALLVAGGFAFKVAAVPFHMWTPDVYEGAPTPVTALMSAGVKAAAFAAMIRVFLVLGKGMDPSVPLALFSGLAYLTMIVGNLLALPQRNVKRMLAYSSIGHAGYLLVGVAALFVTAEAPAGDGFRFFGATPLLAPGLSEVAARADALKGLLFYLLAYTVTTVGSFGVLAALERSEDEPKGTAWDLDRFAGLAQRRPGWAFAMAVFMLSLGGVPPTVGFMGKLLIFRSAVDTGLVGLAVVGVLTSAAAIYYYLRVVVAMYMRPAPEDERIPVTLSWGTELALALSALAVVVLGILPGTVTDWLQQASTLWLGQ